MSEKYNRWDGVQICELIAFEGVQGRYEVIEVGRDGRAHVQPATPDAWDVVTLYEHFAQKQRMKEAH